MLRECPSLSSFPLCSSPSLCLAPPKTLTIKGKGPYSSWPKHTRARHTQHKERKPFGCTVKQATETMGGGHFVKSGMVGMSGILPAVAGMMVGMGAIYHAVRNMKVSCMPSA